MPDENTDQIAPAPQAVDLEEFDLDAFADGAVRPHRVVPVIRDRQLAAEVLDARQKVIDLTVDQRDEDKKSRRRAGSSTTPELDEAVAEYDALMDQARGSFAYVRVEDLTRKVRNQARKAANGDPERFDAAVLAQVAQVFAVDPREHPDAPGKSLPAGGWEKFEAAIGAEQFNEITAAINEITAIGVSPDFSLPASLSRDGGTSSKS